MLHRIWLGWKAFGRSAGNLLARIVLTIFYFTVFVPFGLASSLFGDELKMKATPDRFWRPREEHVDSLDTARRQG